MDGDSTFTKSNHRGENSVGESPQIIYNLELHLITPGPTKGFGDREKTSSVSIVTVQRRLLLLQIIPHVSLRPLDKLTSKTTNAVDVIAHTQWKYSYHRKTSPIVQTFGGSTDFLF